MYVCMYVGFIQNGAKTKLELWYSVLRAILLVEQFVLFGCVCLCDFCLIADSDYTVCLNVNINYYFFIVLQYMCDSAIIIQFAFLFCII